MTDVPADVDVIIIRRLLRYYDPFGPLGLTRCLARQLVSRVPARTWVDPPNRPTGRDDDFHAGRIRWLMENPASDPISLDNDCACGTFGPPIVVDGHHRLCAAILRGEKTIRATYSGLVSTLDWLTGRRRIDALRE